MTPLLGSMKDSVRCCKVLALDSGSNIDKLMDTLLSSSYSVSL